MKKYQFIEYVIEYVLDFQTGTNYSRSSPCTECQNDSFNASIR